MENLFKHKIFFTHPRGIYKYEEGGKVKWSGIYKVIQYITIEK